MANFTAFGNDLYTGARSIDFVGRRKLWYLISAVLLLLAIAGPFLRGGYSFGIEFEGGSEFQVANVAGTADRGIASDVVASVAPDVAAEVTTIGAGTIRVQTEPLPQEDTREIREELATAYGVTLDDVSASLVGPSWGADITAQALRALVIFLVLVGIVMALYFRTWKMSLAALVALVHDLVLTAGIYGILGFEVTPAAVIGLLTILAYSLYDTVVVFDKIRENTSQDGEQSRRTFSESVNLAVNQTLVRSINTSIVAALPVASILFIGAFVLGAGTLRDIALALFIGILVGTYSTIFIAAPLYAQLREGEPETQRRGVRPESVNRAANPSGAVR
ncbi:protein translocase subunit SecF [Lysobacter korlensis]|uniref:Protein-export membrane protein SecF n=1 Tax=Lysobacter korlensis TaxID=553636 RepID=A0ABV6RNA0_9GAMM